MRSNYYYFNLVRPWKENFKQFTGPEKKKECIAMMTLKDNTTKPATYGHRFLTNKSIPIYNKPRCIICQNVKPFISQKSYK